MSTTLRRFALAGGAGLVAAALAVAAVGGAAADGAGGVTGPAFFVDGEMYRTVLTPALLGNTGAPAHSFDIIYDLPGQPNVAEAAPGDPDYNGGRWKVHAVSYNTNYEATLAAHDANSSGTLDSAEEVEAALADAGPGGATDLGVVASFVCPVIPLP